MKCAIGATAVAPRSCFFCGIQLSCILRKPAGVLRVKKLLFVGENYLDVGGNHLDPAQR